MSCSIEFRDIVKSFPGVKALKGVSFSIEKAEVHAIVGENGAGKSTLMNILGGQYQADQGEILLDGRTVAIRNQSEAIRLGVGIVYQEIKLCPNLTIAENLFLGREKEAAGGRARWSVLEGKTRGVLQELGSDLDPRAKVETLSVANQQLVEIARALSRDASVIVMDEPTSALTVKESESLFSIIANLKAKGVTILYISHRMEEIFRICDRISVMRDGEYLGTYRTDEIDHSQIITLIAGRELAVELAKNETCCIDYGSKVLEVQHLSRKGCFNDVSFHLYEREILGFYGLQGAGRTEILETLFGLASEWTGEIIAFGKPVRNKSPAEAITNGFAMVPENRRDAGIFPDMSILENINSANAPDIAGTMGILKGMNMQGIYDESIKSLSVKASRPEAKIKELSGGNQQKVVIAKWLAVHPRILLIDEPTRGIDVGAKAEIFKIIKQLRENGLSVIIVSSELSEILSESDRILVMKSGTLVADLPAEEATRERVIHYAL